MGFPKARYVVDGLRLVLGAFLIENSNPEDLVDARSVEVSVRELVGREGAVRFAPIESVGASGTAGGLVMTTSPRSEAVWAIVISVVAIPISIGSILAIISDGGSMPNWFVASWATGWVVLLVYRLAVQGRAFHSVLAAVSPAPSELRVSWTARRPDAQPARRR
jgi:hypothetical protein